MTQRTGMSLGVLLLALLCAVSFGAIVRVAAAGDNYHNPTCGIWHGFYAGSSPTDNSFFARVDAGCSSTQRHCGPMSFGGEVAYLEVYDTTSTCNAWSRTWGDIPECAGGARVGSTNVFVNHDHAVGSAGC